MKNEIKESVTDEASQAEKAADTVAGKAGEVLREARDYAAPMVEQAQDTYRQVADRAREGLQGFNKVVRENPSSSVAAAFGVGIGLGVVLGLTTRSGRYY
jgi:ElaB/YqjD/DUF883 family membrane-anchored ribosome-binding protein